MPGQCTETCSLPFILKHRHDRAMPMYKPSGSTAPVVYSHSEIRLPIQVIRETPLQKFQFPLNKKVLKIKRMGT